MVIISKATINKYGYVHPDCEGALSNWYKLTKKANWNNFHELKETFNSTDSVGNN